MTPKTFEELGREADRSNQTAANARQWARELGSPAALRAVIVLDIRGKRWEDGTIPLAEVMAEVAEAVLPDILEQALDRLDLRAKAARVAMREAFDGIAGEEDGRSEDRLEDETMTAAAEAAARAMSDRPPLPGDVKATLPPEVEALPGPARQVLLYVGKNGPRAQLAITDDLRACISADLVSREGSGAGSRYSLTDRGKHAFDALSPAVAA